MRGAMILTVAFVIASIAVSGILPLWLDEILQLIETRDTSTAQMIRQLPRNSGAVPLGYLVQQYSLRATGYGLRRARLPMAIFAAAALLAVAALAVEMGVRSGWLAALILGLLPATLRYATESRVYSQALFLSVLATLLYVRLAKRPTPALAVGYYFVLTAAIYTQPYSACVGLAHWIWSTIHREFKTAVYGGIALLLAAAAFVPWVLATRSAWAAGISREGFHFSLSLRTPLMVFREVAGGGTGCLRSCSSCAWPEPWPRGSRCACNAFCFC